MGGGGDGPAWAMAGRFFAEKTPHGPVTLEPTGDWQFTGPVVYLTDERMVSSAETFTWAMTETGRAVQVGRPTGGATIIPRSFDAPSGLFSFRMGVTDRKTPGKGVRPEGIGTPPDLYVPYTPKTLADGRDPILDAGLAVLRDLLSGTPKEKAVSTVRATLEK
jgi:C-terminal processing protease CtpA/Prc